MTVTIVIPARYHSTRFPGKVLKKIAGKSMIQHVYEQGKKACADRVIVATDEARIFETVEAFGGDVCLTAKTHRSGTERINEVVNELHLKKDDIVIGLQGDEPLVPSAIINQLINILKQQHHLAVATLCEPIKDIKDIFNPNTTKVLLDANNFAIYFSHAPIPWYRDGFKEKQLPKRFTYYRHIGIYGYRAEFVKRYIHWHESPIEAIECLEQLRILYHGEKIYVEVACEIPGPGIDTPEDLRKIRKLLAK